MLMRAVLTFLVIGTVKINISAYKRTNVKGKQEFFIVSTTEATEERTIPNSNELNIAKQLEETNRRLQFLQDKLLHTEKLLEKEQTINEKLTQTILVKNLEIVNCSQTLKNEQRLNIKLTQELNKVSASNTTSKPLPRNCKEVLERGNHQSGLYRIKPKNEPFTVLCDMTTRGGGWTVFQNRFDGSQNFYLNWTEYKSGFGDLSREFWLGLEYLHQLTGDGNSELFVKMVNANQIEGYAYYRSFGIDSGQNGYSLKFLNGFEGDAGDSLKYHFGKKFVTKDRNGGAGDNCAVAYEGAWWFHRCLFSNLNGKYLHGKIVETNPGTGINWSTFSTDGASLLASKMMVRPR